MISRRAKATFYAAAGPLMAINGFMYRNLFAPRDGSTRVHLGPGRYNYLKGWKNVDANMFTGKCDVWADLRNPLPFRDSSIAAFYSCHVIEHLPDLQFHFAEAFRCLKPGGVYRAGGPNGDNAIKKFIENDSAWFSDFPVKHKSIGGRLENFIFCKQEHLTILTYSYLEEIVSEIGFTNIKRCTPVNETFHPEFFADCIPTERESTFDVPHTLIIEIEKPA